MRRLKIGKKIISFICITVLFQCLLTVSSFAYFNRGAVSMQLGQSSVSLQAGKSTSVSVSVNPIKEQQLPGCGMAECPQSCGNTGCLNEYGECTCAGTTYQTYYSSVKAVSGNSSVASASYANGTLTIQGISEGKTTVTVTGSMRQYTDCTKTVSVTVTSSGSGGKQTQKPESDSPKAGLTDSDGAEVTKVGSDDGASSNDESDGDGDITEEDAGGDEDGNEASEADDGSEILTTKRGVYEMVPLSEDTDVKTYLQAAIDNKRFVTFQKKSGENVVYSWTFDGTKLENAEDIDLEIEISQELPDVAAQSIKGGDALFLHFSFDGQLPAEAELYVNAASAFDDGERLKLLHLDEETGSLETTHEDINVENGYVTFSIDHCSDYLLTNSDIKDSGISTIVIAALCVVAILAAMAVFFIIRRKRRSSTV